jgi:hypothetical protein
MPLRSAGVHVHVSRARATCTFTIRHMRLSTHADDRDRDVFGDQLGLSLTSIRIGVVATERRGSISSF